MQDMQRHWFDCACGSSDHAIRFTLDPDSGDVYLDVRLAAWRPWYGRLWLACKYVLGATPRYGHYDCTELKTEDLERLRSLVGEALGELQSPRNKPVLKG